MFISVFNFTKKQLFHNSFSCILLTTFFEHILMVASVKKPPEDEIDNDIAVFIFVINFGNETACQ